MNTELLNQAKRLDIQQRIDLAEVIWNLVTSEADDVAIPDWHLKVLEERLADYKKNPAGGDRWKDVRALD